jgi:hypothetical protein
MRNFKIVVLLLFCVFISCSNNCPDTYDISRIEIFNYVFKNVDNVVITGYKNDSTFNTPLETFKITRFEILGNNSADNYCYLNKKLNTNYDYDVFFIDFNVHCKITGIKVRHQTCSEGIFPDNYSYSFDKYYVNGLIFKCQILKAYPIDH